ncbi:MAG: TonB-dependent receptor [Roseateles sp.]|uniref:TonB-dependent receptor domain-containing protein n=1 Tax=Roseateles sp. TaxID=1971397 RepID=UPI0039E7D61F
MSPAARALAAAAALLTMLAARAQTAPAEPAEADPGAALPEVRVKAKRLEEDLPADKAVTVIDAAQITRVQTDNVFDVLKQVPGVGVAGGPRASGMRFTLRGFTENEDVMFKIDGAVKGFEKYRFGGGVFLEPELLKAIAVERGPSVQSGSGALGGTISATTKSAMDLLRPGERAGALLKLGYGENNGERLRMGAVFGRPTERIDLLAAVVKRDSHDIRLPDRTRLPLSATHAESRLFKIGVMPLDALLIELGHTAYTSGPEATPYDATGGRAGVGGVVRRTIDDQTTHLRFSYEPSGDFTLRGMASREKTHLLDHHVRGESRICVGGPIASCEDYWQYDIANAEVFADLKGRLGPVAAAVTLGAQALRNQRQVRRVTSLPLINERDYPDGYNGNQPPGDKHSEALIADARFTWGDWTLAPGARWDHYTVIARGGTRTNMLREGQAPEISFSKAQPSLGLTWQAPGSPWSVTARYNQAFRPPLIDQYFRDGSGNSAGQSGLCMRTEYDILTGGIVTANSRQPLYDPAGLGKPYDAALDHAPLNGICGALYRPQESVNKELTLAWAPRPGPAGQWYARLTAFRIHTRHLLTSLQWRDGRVAQPGVEKRRGAELELRWDNRRYFGDLNLATVRRSERDSDALQASSIESFSIPPDSANATLGLRAFANRLEAGWRVRHLTDRQAYAAGAAPVCLAGTPDALGVATQKGATLHDLFASWKFSDAAQLRASVDNLDNRDYCLTSSFAGAVGFHAPGRAGKVAVTVQF